LNSGIMLQNPRISNQARRQANPLTLINLVSDQALRFSRGVLPLGSLCGRRFGVDINNR
jgi:hypothetical protein